MTRDTFVPAGMFRRWATRLACSLLASTFPLISLYAQQPSTPPAQSAPQPAAGQPPAGQQEAQPSDPSADATQPTIRVGVNEVNLIFTVTDKHGHYIPNLKQSDFALLDDQKAPA